MLVMVCTCLTFSARASAQSVVSRDSAGVRIVTSPAPALTGSAQWRFDPNPIVSIGVLDGPREQILTNVVGATVLQDGTVVVGLNTRSMTEIRYFDRSGEFVATVSGKGGGPGEFDALTEVFSLPGDSLLAIGRGGVRFAYFDPAPEVERAGRLTLPYPVHPLDLVRPNILLAHKGVRSPSSRDPDYRGTVRPGQMFVEVDLASGGIDTLTVLPGVKQLVEPNWFYPYPFSPDAHGAAGRGRVWLGRSDVDEIIGYSHGEPTTIIRHVWPAREVTREDRSRWREERLEGLTGDYRRRIERRQLGLDFPDRMPRFQALEVDRAGNLWVLRHEPPWSAENRVWKIYGSQGEWLTTVEFPFEALGHQCEWRSFVGCNPVLEIGEDYLLLRHADELGVVRVNLHRLIKRD